MPAHSLRTLRRSQVLTTRGEPCPIFFRRNPAPLKRITHLRVGRSGLSRHVAGLGGDWDYGGDGRGAGKRIGVDVARESQDRSEFVGNI